MPRIPPPVLANSGTWNRIRERATRSSAEFCLFRGDACEVLKGLPAGIVNTVLTSPPYWGARDYEHPEQVGLEDEMEDYARYLVKAFREIGRVLTKDGTAWLNLGDCYLHGASSNRGGQIAGWKRNKQLALVPFRVAIALQEDGWLVRNVVTWHKPNAMPASVRDRLTNSWEPVFLLSKEEQYYFDLDAIREPHKTDDTVERRRAENGVLNGKARGRAELRKWLNSPRHRSTIEGLREIRRRPNAPDPVELAAYLREALEAKGKTIQWAAKQLSQPFERVRHYFRTDRIGSRLPPEETWELLKDLLDLGTEYDDAMAVEVGDNVFRNHPKGRNPGDVFSVAVAPVQGDHFAVMPLRLATRMLRATLPLGGVSLDPFMGFGTTGRATISLGGRFVGVDVRSDFLTAFARSVHQHRLALAST